MTDQLDMFTLLAADAEARDGVPTLFTLRCARPADYRAPFEAWTAEYGRSSSILISHAWLPDYLAPEDTTDTCEATILEADLGCDHWASDDTCSCVGDRVWRGVCRGCSWHGEIRDDDDEALFDALDHTHPGWRDLPVVDDVPFTDGTTQTAARIARWTQTVLDLYGDQTPGCPVITRRTPPGTRSVPGRSPWNGYDIAAHTLTRLEGAQ